MVWYEQLPAGLTEGRLVTPYNGVAPRYWMSADPLTQPGAWRSWHGRHGETGLWPLLMSDVQDDDPIKLDDEHNRFTTIEQHDAAALLEQWWLAVTESDGEPEETSEMAEVYGLDAIGRHWPGVAAPPAMQGPAGLVAAEIADLHLENGVHLALVPAVDGAHALAAIGWTGPLNHDNDTATFAAVVRSWQERFGATVVGLSFDTLTLSVAAPPMTAEHALHVTAEHFAFCPDNIWQSETDSFEAYASAIRGRKWWTFWWD